MTKKRINWDLFRESVARDTRTGTCYVYQVILSAIKIGITDLSTIPHEVLPWPDIVWGADRLEVDLYNAKL